jgi:hypothetical protein
VAVRPICNDGTRRPEAPRAAPASERWRSLPVDSETEMTAGQTPVERMPARRIVAHAETWMALDELGKASRPYLPTYQEAGESIDAFHRHLATCPSNGLLIDLGLEGWLQRADALKLYELGYFAGGDILEFGTYRGLSAFILAKAIEGSGRSARIVTMELDPETSAIARSNLAARSMDPFVEFRVGVAESTCDELLHEGRRFSLAFVDHSHAYEPMVLACQRLPKLLAPGSFCLFHDFNDPRNDSHAGVGESETRYGVYAAIQAALDPAQFEFYGIFGCCGLYRKVS